jgi:hypothetical protein
MCVISFIEDQDAIKKILQRRTRPQALGIMGSKPATLPAGKAPSTSQSQRVVRSSEYIIDYSTSHLTASNNHLYVDPEQSSQFPL